MLKIATLCLLLFLPITEAHIQDSSRSRAEKLCSEAKQLKKQQTSESFQKAIEKYTESLPLWKEAADRLGEADAMISISEIFILIGQVPKAIEHQEQALSIYRSINNRSGEAKALYFLGESFLSTSQIQKAQETYKQALSISREIGDRQNEARALGGIANVEVIMGQAAPALEHFNQALELSRAVGDQETEGQVLGNIGIIYSALGDKKKALELYTQSLPLRRASGDRQGEGVTLSNMAAIQQALGEIQQAINLYKESLVINRSLGDRRQEGVVLSNLGVIYLNLGELKIALDYLTEALPLSQAVNDRRQESTILNNLGTVYNRLGQLDKSLDVYNRALKIVRDVGERLGESTLLNNLAFIHYFSGDKQKSLEFFNQSLAIKQAIGNRSGQPEVLTSAGVVYGELGEVQKAIGYFEQAIELSRAIGDRRQESYALSQLARAQREQGKLEEACKNVEVAIKLAESIRQTVASQESRSSFLSTVQDYYELYIDALMRRHAQEPKAGYDSQALQVSERARARSLLELLSESRADIRQGADPELVARERNLQLSLNDRAERLIRIKSANLPPERVAAVLAATEKDIDSLTAQLQEVRAQIRQKSPRYAALTQPQPLGLQEIQKQVLDSDTLLLEYAIGREHSYLWAVTQTSISSYKLPRSPEINGAAQRVYDLLTARNRRYKTVEERRAKIAEAEAEYPKAVAALGEMVLGPVASNLQKKRILLVSDAALQYIPFGALPLSAGSPPLVVDHEIVSLPSASTMALLRQESSGRRPASKAIAVFADPVFNLDDPRVKEAANKGQKDLVATRSSDNDLERATRDLDSDSGQFVLNRLISTREEAEAVTSNIPASERKVALGFDANRAFATSPDLEQYRIVHFASHGLLNSARPELSGIVLSLVDEQGHPQDGFLRLHDIYNLKLPAELVVLSACQTGLGKEIKGEGLVGLTRGFMYAGAARVMASLWKVDDEATAELMKHFYEGILKQRQSPAAALRNAQVYMLKQKRWQSPFYWAAFILQGEF
jgi:CHAT domain-containing protein/Tfp pilus assembly protein PilF